jgi:hypothetical protein
MSRLTLFKNIRNLVMLGSRGELGHVTETNTFRADPALVRQFASYTVRFLRDYHADINNHRYRVGLIYHSATPKAWGTETLRLTDAVAHTLYPVTGATGDELTGFQRKKLENSIFYGMELLLEHTLKDMPEIPAIVPVLFDRGTVLGDYVGVTSGGFANENAAAPVIEVLNLVGPATNSRDNIDALRKLREHVHGSFVRKGARKELDLQYEGQAATSTPTMPVSEESVSVILRSVAHGPKATSPQWYDAELDDDTSRRMKQYLVQPMRCASLEQVRQFTHFSSLTPVQQLKLVETCPVYFAPTGTTLLERGSTGQWNLYLLFGMLRLTAADGAERTIEGGTDPAHNAIASLKPRMFTVTAQTPVRFLWVHDSIVAAIQRG